MGVPGRSPDVGMPGRSPGTGRLKFPGVLQDSLSWGDFP